MASLKSLPNPVDSQKYYSTKLFFNSFIAQVVAVRANLSIIILFTYVKIYLPTLIIFCFFNYKKYFFHCPLNIFTVLTLLCSLYTKLRPWGGQGAAGCGHATHTRCIRIARREIAGPAGLAHVTHAMRPPIMAAIGGETALVIAFYGSVFAINIDNLIFFTN